MNLSFPHCRPGSAQRGEETKRRILDAAIETFAAVGYEAAHTRLLAERAGVKLPAISYYFGSKEGLYRAAVEHIAGQFEQRMVPYATQVAEGLKDLSLPRGALIGLLCDLLDAFVATSLGPATPESWRKIMVFGEIENLAAMEPLHASIRRHVVQPCRAVINRLLGGWETEERSWMRAAAILGQINIFMKPPVRHGLGWTEYTDERVRGVQEIVRGHVQAIFAADGVGVTP